MPENLNQSVGKAIDSKFSSDSVKTISDAKVSSKVDWNERSSQTLTQSAKDSDVSNGKQKLHNRCCKARRYRKNKFYKCKSRGFSHHPSHVARPSTIKAKICKTSPSLQDKKELVSAANIKSVSNSDGANCSIKASDRWKFRKVLNKLRCFSTKVVPDSNLSKIKIWNSCAEKVGSSLSSHFNLSSHSWNGKKLIKKLSWRKSGPRSVPNTMDAVTDQSSKSLDEGHTDVSNCSTCANEIENELKYKEVHTVHPIQEVQSSKNLKSVECIRSSDLTQHETTKHSSQKTSEKSVDITIINLEDNNNSSFESTETSSTSRRNFSADFYKLRQLKSAPALIKNSPCIKVSFVEAPIIKESPKVTIVVDKMCQAEMSQTLQTLNGGKVTTSTSCGKIEISPKCSDKEIQNDIDSFQAVNTSVNKMCQTSLSVGTLSSKDNENTTEKICCAETCKEALNEVSQLASKLLEVTSSEKKSEAETMYTKKSSDRSSKCSGADGKDLYNLEEVLPTMKDTFSKCHCSEDCKSNKDKPKRLMNERLKDPVVDECMVNQKCMSNSEYQEHAQGRRVVLVAEGGHSCLKSSLKFPVSLSLDSNLEVDNQKMCHSVGFIQQPSALKSSSSFLKVNFSRALDDASPNQPNCYACNIHKNPEVWQTKDSCCIDFPLTRSNFLKLYPEPYINHLSNNLSNVQLIFHKKDKNQKQMYVCQGCKKNASWNRHVRKHHYSPNWRKSPTSCGSVLSCNVVDCTSSGDNLSRPSMASCVHHHPKPKRILKGKIRLQSNPKYDNFKKYAASRPKISQDGRGQCCQNTPNGHLSSSISFREFNPSNSHPDFDKLDGFLHFSPPPPPLSTTQQTATEVLLPPPPPPLYEYPPYLCDPEVHKEKYPQNKQTSMNKRYKSPEYARPVGNGKHKSSTVERHQYCTRYEVSPPRQRKSSPSFSHCHQLKKKHQSPKRILSSESDISNIICTSTNKRYANEKKVTGYYSYNKPSNYLLKYPGFGDCIPPQPVVKLKPKPSTTRQGTKTRKKIRDKYKRNGTSVRCLIRNALTTEGNNTHEKRNFIPEKPKRTPTKDLSAIESQTKITTLFDKTLNDYSRNLDRDRTNVTMDDKKLINKNRKTGGIQKSKNTFCALSDSIATSESVIRVSNLPEVKTHRRIVRSESMQFPKSPIPLREQKIMKRYSEELIRTPTLSTNRRFACLEKDKTQEIFANANAEIFSSKSPSENHADSSASDESIAQYFRILDAIAKKRQQFKKEEKKRQRIQELKEKQTKIS